jgi:O-antigen/teichoic acid export membrane protein
LASLTRNVVANYAGTAWIIALQLAVVPVCVRLVGVEAWGVIAFFASLQAVLALFDLGMGATVGRELSRLSTLPDGSARMRDTLRTLEVLYWGTGLLLAVAIWVAAPWLATRWLRPEQVPVDAAITALRVLGVALALRWPNTLYWGGLAGLERQGVLNAQRVAAETLRHGGAVAVLWLGAPTLLAYAAWHCVAGLVSSATAGGLVWRCLPRGLSPARFRGEVLHALWRFAAGMGLVSALGVLLAQLDKLVLGRMLSLEAFGAYAVAATAAGGLALLAGPVHQAYFPRLVKHGGPGAAGELAAVYHGGCRLVATMLLPSAASGILFAEAWLGLWLQDVALAQRIAPVFSVLLLAACLNGLFSLPWALQIAAGWTGLALRLNVVATALALPGLVFSAGRAGPLGAAAVWLGVNLLYLVAGIHLMHRRLLPGEKWTWYLRDVALPAAAAFGAAGLVRLVADGPVAAVVALALAFTLTRLATGGRLLRLRAPGDTGRQGGVR